MSALDSVRWALRLTDDSAEKLVRDMRDEPLARPAPGVGNHPLWVIGHLAVIEGMVPNFLTGEPNPLQHWWPLFGTGTEPSDDSTAYPSLEEVLETYRELRAKNLAKLEAIGEEGLGEAPKVITPGFEDHMRTVGRAFHLIALHQMFHLGQVADARRAVGRRPFV